MSFRCDLCNKTFSQETNLVRHKKALHSGRSFTCERCGEQFNRKDALKRHEKKHSRDKEHQCQHCNRKFYRRDKLEEHQKVCEYEKLYEDQNKKRKIDDKENEEPAEKRVKIDDTSDKVVSEEPCNDKSPCELTSAMQDSLKTFKYKPRIREKYDLRLSLQGKKKVLLNRLRLELSSKKGLKWFVSVQVKFIKPKADGSDITSEPHFRSLCMTSVNYQELEQQLNEAHQKILSAFATYQREGSGWLLEEVLHLDLNVARYTPIKGSSYIPLPKKLKDKKAIVNVKNSDNKCFMWSVLAAIHPVEYKCKPERIHHYQPHEHELNFDNIEFPVSISKVSKFEKQNQIAVNVFGFEHGDLFPVYITKERFDTHVDHVE